MHLILTQRVRLLIKSAPEVFFSVIRKFLPAKIFGNFPFGSLSFINKNLNVFEIHSFKPLLYTCKCNN